MTDDDFPPRLRTASNEHVKSLLEDVSRDAPSSAQVAATVAGVMAKASASRALGGASMSLKVLGVVGSIGAIALVAALATNARHETPPAPAVVEQPKTTPIEAPTRVPEPTPTIAETAPAQTAPVASVRKQAPTPAASSSADDGTMAIELQRVLAIRSRMLAKDPAAALAGAEAYEHDYPNGSFVPEAEAMAIEALNDTGRTSEAKTRADLFLARHGNSPQAVRIRALREKMP
jgi:hypothetical protein